MLKVPNNKTIFSLALRQLKSSWLKNIFSVAAIILTTMLIMTILTIGNTLMEAGKAAQMKDTGQKSEVSFQCLLKNEADAISSHDMVEKLQEFIPLHGIKHLLKYALLTKSMPI